MHMLSKKGFELRGIGHFARVQEPHCGAYTQWGSAHKEEAQVYVHDLDLFVTVQLLEETPAVLSLGKLCEDHGYSYEWVSGQKPRLTKEEKTIMCKTDNFVHLVVRGYPPVLGAIRRQHRHRRICLQQVQLKKRGDELAPRQWCRSSSKKTKTKKKRDDSRDADNRLRDLPEWLEEFHRKSRRCRRARTRTHCARLRFGTSCKSGTVLKATSQKTEIAKSACEPK